jgi:YVTN family beta-propeller protein
VPKRVSMTRGTLLFLLACGGALTGLPATAQTLLTTIATGSYPEAMATNPATKKLYVANLYSNNITVIDEASYSTATIPVGSYPSAVAVNPVTNKIYVANQNSNTVTVIDGVTGSTAVVNTGRSPRALDVNSVTNQIYVANYFDHSVTAINGANNSTVTITAGSYPTAVAVNPSTNKIYVANLNSDAVTVIDGMSGNTVAVIEMLVWSPRALQFVPATPCRVVDTRKPNGEFGGPAISGAPTATSSCPTTLVAAFLRVPPTR